MQFFEAQTRKGKFFPTLKTGFYRFLIFTFRLRKINPIVKIIGNTTAVNNPTLRLPPAISENLPTIAGLTAAPKSPAKAKKANIAVPPMGHFCDEILIVPGHIIPTANPQREHPVNPNTEESDNDASK